MGVILIRTHSTLRGDDLPSNGGAYAPGDSHEEIVS